MKAMRKAERKEQRRAAKDKDNDPLPKLMVEKELKKGELGKEDRKKLQEIVKKPNKGSVLKKHEEEKINPKEADKVAREMLERDKYEEAVGGLDSSIDSEEFDREVRDQVDGNQAEGAATGGGDKHDFSKNSDLTYYSLMDQDEKLMTLQNRAKMLHEKHKEMMREIKICEALYPAKNWVEKADLGYLSDEVNSQMSGYSSAGSDLNNLQFLAELRSGTNANFEEGKSSTADDTEASQAQTSIMQGETSSAASQFSKSPYLAQKKKERIKVGGKVGGMQSYSRGAI